MLFALEKKYQTDLFFKTRLPFLNGSHLFFNLRTLNMAALANLIRMIIKSL